MDTVIKGLVDDNNLYEWEVMIIGCVRCPRYLPMMIDSRSTGFSDQPTHSSESYGVPKVQLDLIFPLIHSEGGIFKARLTFPEDFPLNPPKMRFITPMWHPNSCVFPTTVFVLFLTHHSPVVYPDGSVCISILVGCGSINFNQSFTLSSSTRQATISMDTRILGKGGCLCTPSSQS